MSYKLRITAVENFRKGENLFRQGRYEEAVSCFRQSAWDYNVRCHCYACLLSYDLVLKYGGEEILRINKSFHEYNLS